jgi:hypothetical protein
MDNNLSEVRGALRLEAPNECERNEEKYTHFQILGNDVVDLQGAQKMSKLTEK